MDVTADSIYSYTYTGIFYLYGGGTNNPDINTIHTHGSGHAIQFPYEFRTLGEVAPGTVLFQMRRVGAATSSYTYNFEFRRIF